MRLEVRGLSVRFGDRCVLDDVNLVAAAGAVTGLIGPNGAGKTTLLDAVTGFVAAEGQVLLDGRRLSRAGPHERARRGLVRTFQSLELFEDLSVAENVRAAAEASGRADPDDVLERLELGPVATRLPVALSTAERARLALARALAARPGVVLLDEPAAGLDAGQRRALGRLLRELAADGTAVLVVDHDTDLVLGVCDAVHVLHAGRVIASGTPEQVRTDPGVVEAYLGTSSHRPLRAGAAGEREPAVAVDGLRAGYRGVPVLDGVALTVVPGELVAVLGRNGAGKSTLLRCLAGLHRPDSGQVAVLGEAPDGPARTARRGVTLLPQGRGLFRRLTGAQNLRLVRPRLPVDDVLARLPDLAGQLDRPVGELSGGQQQQLALARALVTAPRVLLVDELSFGLSPQVADRLLDLVRELADSGAAVLVVEQHASLALSVAQRGYVLDRGRVVLSGTAEELAGDPSLRGAYLGE